MTARRMNGILGTAGLKETKGHFQGHGIGGRRGFSSMVFILSANCFSDLSFYIQLGKSIHISSYPCMVGVANSFSFFSIFPFLFLDSCSWLCLQWRGGRRKRGDWGFYSELSFFCFLKHHWFSTSLVSDRFGVD